MPALIDTTVMPGDDMAPGLIEAAATNFRSVGTKVGARGAIVVARWEKLAGVYDAPEEQTLIQAMDPVQTRAEAFGNDLDTAAKALDAFAEQVRTVKAEVAKIRADAATFVGGITDGKVAGGYYGGGEYYSEPRDWHADPASVDTNNALIRRTNDQQEALEAAERACATAIRAVVGLAPVRPRTASNPGGYGSTDIPDTAPMPWGAASGRTEGCADHVTTGVLADGLGGLLADAGSLAGLSYTPDDGLDWSRDTMGQAGLGLLTFAAGAAAFSIPGLIAGQTIPGPVGSFLRKAQFTLPAGVASLAAIDLYAKDPLHKWKDNSARAGGETLFNAATIAIAPLKITKAGGSTPGSQEESEFESPPPSPVDKADEADPGIDDGTPDEATPPVEKADTAAGSAPTASTLANDLTTASGGALRVNKGGYTVEIPHGSRGITVRIMEHGGGRTQYYRVSIPGKASYTRKGDPSTDARETHMDIEQNSLEDMLAIIKRIKEAG